MDAERDYATISPSAFILLLMKGYSNLPFAKQAAEWALLQQSITPVNAEKDFAFWARLVHFEDRYWSIDQLLNGLTPRNILEISSGFSFRGLQKVKNNNVHYLDTDLPNVVDAKRNIIEALKGDEANDSKYELMPLNVLDEHAFADTVANFNANELVIVNEGLLMYLTHEEKQKLCSIIHGVLKQRGGYWITADIYTRAKVGDNAVPKNEWAQKFFELHNIEANKFECFEAAKTFFEEAGFVIEKIAQPDKEVLSSLPKMLAVATPAQLATISTRRQIRQTWMLRAV